MVGGPHDFVGTVLRMYEYCRLRRQSLGRGSPPGDEVAPKDGGRVSAGFGGKRATEKIYAPERTHALRFMRNRRDDGSLPRP
jgi:hypothetical protein